MISRKAVRLSPLPLVAAGLALILAAPAVAPLHGQGITTAAAAGRVVDAEGRPVPDARVEVRNEATGTAAATFTGEDGRFHLANLRPGGPYTLSVTKLGFAPATREDLTLTLGQVLRVDLTLSEEAVQLPELRVEVRTDLDFNPSRIGAVTTVDQRTFERLPTITRNFVDFAALSPLAKTGEGGEGISVAGQNLRFNNIQVDGALNQDVFGLSPSGVAGGRANARPIPLEAIEQFQVLVAPYDVRQSGFTGGVLNAVTRSGTNEWQGSAFAYVRDERLVGELVVDDVPRKPDQLDNFYFGATLGGPIRRDRIHFFAAAELERRRRPPSGFHVGLDDPLRTLLDPEAVSSLQNALRIRGFDPGAAGSVTLTNDLANAFVRVDAQLSERHRLLARHNLAGARDHSPPNRLPGDAYDLSSHSAEIEALNNSTVLQLVSTLGDRVSNELFVNVQFLRDRERPLADYPRVEVDVTSELDGREFVRRVRAGADVFAHANELDQNIIQIADNLTFSLGGGHRLLTGAGLERFGIRRLFRPGSLGSYRFASVEDLLANQPASYEFNVPAPDVEDPATRFSVLQLSAYVQDEWAVSDRLSFLLGLRADVPVIPTSPRGNPAFAEAFPGLETDRMPSGKLLLSPRAGVNARLGPRGGTQIRGGVGLFTGRPPFVWLANAYQNTGLETLFLTCAGDAAPPLDPSGAPPRACLDGTLPGEVDRPTINVLDPDFRFPQDLKMSVGVDQRLPLDFVASVEWLYTLGVNHLFLEETNLGQPVAAPRDEDGYTDGLGFDGGGREAFGTPTVDGYSPNRQSDEFSQVVRVTNRSRNFAYAASAEIRRAFARRFGLRVGYSLTRSADLQSLVTDDVTSNFGLTPAEVSPNDPQLQPSLFDQPHKVVAHAWGRLLERLGGTEIGIFYVGQSGRPYSYVYASDINGDGYPGPGRAQDLTNDLIFVPIGAFDYPGGFQGILLEQLIIQEPCLQKARNSVLARNACRLPWSNRLDLRLAQNIRAGGARVQVTFDLLNALNFLDSERGRVATVNPVVQILQADGRTPQGAGLGGATPRDPLRVRFMGPVIRDPETGTFRAALPSTFEVPTSQWQAQLGVRVAF